MKANQTIKTSDSYAPKKHKSYTIDQILAAGGTTAFAIKLGKNPGSINNKLATLPNDAFLTNQELNDALTSLNEVK